MNRSGAHCNIEYLIPDTRYKADGYSPSINTIFEFHGDFWHGNPKKHDKNDVHPVVKKTYGELYNDTKRKKSYCIEHKYKYISIWESEFEEYQELSTFITKHLLKIF